MSRLGIDDPSKAEAIAVFLRGKSVSSENVRNVIALEDEGRDTDTFWQQVADGTGVNTPSRKVRERVAALLAEMEARYA